MAIKIFITELIYHGKNTDLYEAYPHVTFKGAGDHVEELAEKFIADHDGKEPFEKEEERGHAFIDYGDLFCDNLTINVVEREMDE